MATVNNLNSVFISLLVNAGTALRMYDLNFKCIFLSDDVFEKFSNLKHDISNNLQHFKLKFAA